MYRTAIACAVAATAVLGAAAARADLDAVWIAPESETQGLHLRLEVELAPESPAGAPIVFPCLIASRTGHGGAAFRMTLEAEDGSRVQAAELALDLVQGRNRAEFSLDPAGIAPGTYRLRFWLDYAPEFAPAEVVARLYRVTGGAFGEALARLEARLAEIDASADRSEAAGRPLPYVRLETEVARRGLAAARAAREAGDWRRLSAMTMASDWVLGRAFVNAVLTAGAPETAQPPAAPPAFLAGAAIEHNDAGAVAQLAMLGLNFITLDIAPAETLPAPGSTAAPAWDAAFDAAAAHNVAVAVELRPDSLPGWALDANPGALKDGVLHLADPGLAALTERHLDVALPYAASKPATRVVSLADAPVFRFDGESVRQRFIEHMRAQYPERQALTRTWRAHFGKFEDITIWDSRYPWQSGHAYQYDWQSFHRGLAMQYFAWLKAAAQQRAPQLAFAVTLPDAAFSLGETRSGIGREALAALMDAGAAATRATAPAGPYGNDYPHDVALYTLMRSLAPGKPLYDLELGLPIGDGMNPARAYAQAHSALWEAAMAGAAGVALPARAAALDHPAALEGYAAACLEINRFGRVVEAFRNAPAEVGVLYSDASKLFDDGTPHLGSALRAFEGASFAGHHIRFLTEAQIQTGALDTVRVFVLPDTPALAEPTFARIAAFADRGGVVARAGSPIPYNERGESRHDVIRNTANTRLVRGDDAASQYLHAMDGAIAREALPPIARPINAFGYPLEGVRTRYVEIDGDSYLYCVNLRQEAVTVHLAGNLRSGRDLIHGNDVAFPRDVPPLVPMLVRLSREGLSAAAAPVKTCDEMTRRERRDAKREAKREARREFE